MELTKEQKAIIASTGDIKINAVAGSGKTTTIIEYARTRPKGSPILYLAFNKSVRLEAEKKFAAKGLSNVKVETAHSLAYKHIVYRSPYTVRQQAYKTSEIAEILQLPRSSEKHTEFVLANHIGKFTAYFCNSDTSRVQDLNYLDLITDEKTRTFVKAHYEIILKQTRVLLAKMDKAEIDITHDFYLKKFQLSNPELPYDYILFDEGQDASPAMLDVFLKQPATKVIVGDAHQQIYSWRFAVNSLEKVGFTTYHLSNSFRFSQPIADLAMEVLQLKEHIQKYTPVPISGLGKEKTVKTRAILARTNLGLLLKAIEYITEKKHVKGIYFEGNISSYTYADEGASLYDVLNLYNGSKKQIKDTVIGTMKNMEELEEYIEKTEDVQLDMMVEIVKEYGNQIPGILRELKSKHVENDAKEKAGMIFSTVHRCKGMEYDSIELVNDFITEAYLQKPGLDVTLHGARLNEEINLLYVAVTRTRNQVLIPELMVPAAYEGSEQVQVLKSQKGKGTETQKPASKKGTSKPVVKEKTYSVDTVRDAHKDAYRPWTKALDEELTRMYDKGVTLTELSKHFNRTKGAVLSRISKLGLDAW